MMSPMIAALFAVTLQAGDRATLEVPIPGTVMSLTLQRVPAGVEIPAFWITATEISWDLYDIFVFSLERGAAPEGVDAVARPSRPYVLPGDAFGHAGRPALGLTFHAAGTFAQWLSVITGLRFRLPTDAEWTHACTSGANDSAIAWHRDRAAGGTHPLGTLAPDANGVHDLLGNTGEWVAARNGDSLVMGGSYRDAPDRMTCSTSQQQRPFWNQTDPQLPKSRWWLSDAPFVGLRLVREP